MSRPRFAPHLQAWAIVLLIAVGYGFVVGWSAGSIGLLGVFAAVAAVHVAATTIAPYVRFGHESRQGPTRRILLHSHKQVRELGPEELEHYLEGLSPPERKKFAAILLKVDPRTYLDKLPPDQRPRFEALLRKLQAERDA